MRHLLAFVLMLALVGSAVAADLGNSSNVVKGNSHVLMNQAWDRDGGEDMASAAPIAAIPFSDTGATCDNVDDYDVACPYEDSTSPDVVYSFTATADMSVTVDLDGSLYDTKVYVADATGAIVACNDDSHLPGYVSFIEEVMMVAGMEYFFIVDGYGGDCGDFVINIYEFEVPEPCVIVCNSDVLEGEPALVNGYEDRFNGGCNSVNQSFSVIEGANGVVDFCGVGGWYIAADGVSEYRDTDWIAVTFGEAGIIEWTVDAESATACYLLDIPDCDNVTVPASMDAGPCMAATMVIEGMPGDTAFLFVGSTSYTQGAAGHPTNEYAYTIHFEGLMATVAVENATWDNVKSMYR